MRATVRLVLPALIALLASCSSSSDSKSGSAGNDGGATSSSGGSGDSSSGGPSDSGSSGSSTTSSDSSSGSDSGPSGSSSGSDSGSGSSSGSDSSSGDAGPCTVGSLPSGGTACSCSSGNCGNCNSFSGGVADGLNYGVWESGTGGNITYFADAHAFSASWGPNSGDFLAHVGLDYNGTSSYTTYGKILAQFAESKSGSTVYSSVGMYGWLQNPCVEWYIVEDSFQSLPTEMSSVTTTIDGGTYYLVKQTTTGAAGANACSGSVSSWTQILSIRSTARECGTITVSDHFAAWANQGWSVGDLSSIHINLEAGGGTGSIQFPMANVSTNN